MTGQLLKVTTTPYQSVHLSQNARLVPSSSIDLERRKAIARIKAFQSQHSSGGGITNNSYAYVRQINRTFSVQSSPQSAASSLKSSPAAGGGSSNVSDAAASIGPSGSNVVSAETVQTTADSMASHDFQAAVSAENNSAYTMERGAFEFRVSNGDVSFLPPLVMTVMTQRPEVHFEYLGSHNYVPPEKFDDNGFMNLLA